MMRFFKATSKYLKWLEILWLQINK
jgi:hypothetical protein